MGRNDTARLAQRHTDAYGYSVIIMEMSMLSAPVNLGCTPGACMPPTGVTVTNSRSNFTFTLTSVIHWAVLGNLFFFSPDVSVEVLNNEFKEGDILVMTYAPVTRADIQADNSLALTFVHGTNLEYGQPGNSFFNAKSRMRWGTTSPTRDGTVWVSMRLH